VSTSSKGKGKAINQDDLTELESEDSFDTNDLLPLSPSKKKTSVLVEVQTEQRQECVRGWCRVVQSLSRTSYVLLL
jgi:hypothetical protein